MSELNREELIKALECLHQRILSTRLAEKITEAEMMAIIDALALIKELTEDLHATRTELTRVQGDTINKFADRLKKYYSNLEDTTLSSMVAYHTDQIAKEMLEG